MIAVAEQVGAVSERGADARRVQRAQTGEVRPVVSLVKCRNLHLFLYIEYESRAAGQTGTTYLNS